MIKPPDSGHARNSEQNQWPGKCDSSAFEPGRTLSAFSLGEIAGGLIVQVICPTRLAIALGTARATLWTEHLETAVRHPP